MALIGLGQTHLKRATSGYGTVAGLETARENQNRQLQAAEESQDSQMVGTGAGIGASMAMGAETGAFAGPWGVALGAGVGALAGLLGAELF